MVAQPLITNHACRLCRLYGVHNGGEIAEIRRNDHRVVASLHGRLLRHVYFVDIVIDYD